MKRLAFVLLPFVLAGCGASALPNTTTSQTAAVQRATTASADNPGQPNTPCAATFTIRHGVLTISVASRVPGELVIQPVVNGTERSGRIRRRDIPHIRAGTTVVRFRGVHSAPQIPTVLYTTKSPGSAKSCSIVRKGDPIP